MGPVVWIYTPRCRVHGTLGFVGALLKIIRATKPTHIAVLFDGEHENSRSYGASDGRLIYPFGVGNNVFKRAELVQQQRRGFRTYPLRSLDIIAEVIISSFDSDFFQLITDKVSVLRYRGKNTVICTPDRDFPPAELDRSPVGLICSWGRQPNGSFRVPRRTVPQ